MRRLLESRCGWVRVMHGWVEAMHGLLEARTHLLEAMTLFSTATARFIEATTHFIEAPPRFIEPTPRLLATPHGLLEERRPRRTPAPRVLTPRLPRAPYADALRRHQALLLEHEREIVSKVQAYVKGNEPTRVADLAALVRVRD